MSWIVRNEMKGPLHLSGIGLMLAPGQIVDLDIIGRLNAEKSNDVKVAIVKNWISILRKDPSPPEGGVSPEIVTDLKAAADKANAAATTLAQQSASQQQVISQQQEALAKQQQAMTQQQQAMDEQRRHNDAILAKAEQILAEVKTFSDAQPMLARTIKEGLENAMAERAGIAAKRAALREDEGHSKEEIEMADRILSMKDKKLEKNVKDIGKTLSKTAESVEESVDALDQLGI